jgi:hypothetical protein
MSDTPLRLPDRPSLEQLRKQAKDRLDTMPGAKLAEAQFALARDYGFDSWPKLVHHVDAMALPELAQHEQLARDMVVAYNQRDAAAAARLNDLFHSALDIDQIRDFIRTRLWPLPDGPARLANLTLTDGRLLVAGLFGFDSWDALIGSAIARGAQEDAAGIATAPPFYRIDTARGIISVRQPMSPRDWDTLIAIMRERGLTGLDANHMMDDAAMERLTAIDDLAVLKVHGCDRLTDRGLRHLAGFEALEDIELGGWHSPMTDQGFAALRGLPRLRSVGSWWSRGLSDAGAGDTLAACPAIEDANFGGTALGDALVVALADKPRVWRVFAGDAVTDAGLRHLHRIPRFARWHGGAAKYGLMDFDAGPTYLAVKGPFTAEGLRSLAGLDGLFALNVHWLPNAADSTRIAPTSADLGSLAALACLGFLALDGDLCDDEALRQIGRLPHLRMLLAQGPAAGDEGFTALSASATLEYLWGRECPHLTGRGFAAMAAMPSLKGLAVSCKQVDDAALAALPRFASLRSLMPMDVTDEGFRHVGKCEQLENLWCMYCRDTGDAATDHIAGLRLKTYYAGQTRITDHSLQVLARMTTLERVHFHYCHGITGAGVQRLASLPNLRELTIEGSRNVPRAATAGFAPSVRINYATI